MVMVMDLDEECGGSMRWTESKPMRRLRMKGGGDRAGTTGVAVSGRAIGVATQRELYQCRGSFTPGETMNKLIAFGEPISEMSSPVQSIPGK